MFNKNIDEQSVVWMYENIQRKNEAELVNVYIIIQWLTIKNVNIKILINIPENNEGWCKDVVIICMVG